MFVYPFSSLVVVVIFYSKYITSLLIKLLTMTDYVELFGDNLLSKEGLVPTSELKGKVVGVYFS